MALIHHCSRILVKTPTRSLYTGSLLPAVQRWRNNRSSHDSDPKINYSYGLAGLLGAAFFGAGAAMYDGQISADELELGHAHMQWDHKEWNKSYDHKALRRGFQVYKEVCQACHSMKYLYWRMHVDVTHTKEEVKEMAAEYMYPDVDDDGRNIERPGDIQDFMPSPYENEIKARLANNGAEPPDITLINIAREGNEDYLFSLLTGYEDVPPGQPGPAEGQAYNPYFHGYYIGMAQQLYNESVDYEDGTIPYQSQIAKDVIQYLSWTSYPYMDETKMYGMKAVISGFLLAVGSYYLLRRARVGARLRQVHFTVPGHEKQIAKNGKVSNFSKYKSGDEMMESIKKN